MTGSLMTRSNVNDGRPQASIPSLIQDASAIGDAKDAWPTSDFLKGVAVLLQRHDFASWEYCNEMYPLLSAKKVLWTILLALMFLSS